MLKLMSVVWASLMAKFINIPLDDGKKLKDLQGTEIFSTTLISS